MPFFISTTRWPMSYCICVVFTVTSLLCSLDSAEPVSYWAWPSETLLHPVFAFTVRRRNLWLGSLLGHKTLWLLTPLIVVLLLFFPSLDVWLFPLLYDDQWEVAWLTSDRLKRTGDGIYTYRRQRSNNPLPFTKIPSSKKKHPSIHHLRRSIHPVCQREREAQRRHWT